MAVQTLLNGMHLPWTSQANFPASTASRNNIVVFSGGSAANNLVDVFESVRSANGNSLKYIIPISDNGGSSSEIIRVFGGPGICFLLKYGYR